MESGRGLAGRWPGDFASEGFGVALMARTEESVAQIREEIEAGGGKAQAVSTDATDPDSVAAAFERVRDELGDPEFCLYNAGAFQVGGILDLSPEQFDVCFKANCAGAMCANSR